MEYYAVVKKGQDVSRCINREKSLRNNVSKQSKMRTMCVASPHFNKAKKKDLRIHELG